jgi:hypothetical protein
MVAGLRSCDRTVGLAPEWAARAKGAGRLTWVAGSLTQVSRTTRMRGRSLPRRMRAPVLVFRSFFGSIWGNRVGRQVALVSLAYGFGKGAPAAVQAPGGVRRLRRRRSGWTWQRACDACLLSLEAIIAQMFYTDNSWECWDQRSLRPESRPKTEVHTPSGAQAATLRSIRKGHAPAGSSAQQRLRSRAMPFALCSHLG